MNRWREKILFCLATCTVCLSVLADPPAAPPARKNIFDFPDDKPPATKPANPVPPAPLPPADPTKPNHTNPNPTNPDPTNPNPPAPSQPLTPANPPNNTPVAPPANPQANPPATPDTPAAPPAPVAPSPALLPLPSAAQLATARKNVDDLYSKEIAAAAKSTYKRLDLAEEMLAAGADETADPNAQYVLLATAHDMAVKSLDLMLACRAIRALAVHFEIDALQHEAATAATIARTPLPPAERRMFCLQIEFIADRAAKANRYDLLAGLDETARAAAASAGDPALIKQIKKQTQDHITAKNAFDATASARQELISDPKNTAANTLVGRFICLEQNDWKRGLPFVSAGSDAKWKQAADAETAATPDAPNKIASLWWDVAAAENEPAKHAVQAHACDLYAASLPALQSLEKTAIARRILTVRSASTETPACVELFDLIDPSRDSIDGTWKTTAAGILISDPNDRTRLAINYCPPKEYDYRVVFTRISGDDMLCLNCVGGTGVRQFAYVLGSQGNTVAGFSLVQGLYSDKNITTIKGRGVENGERHTLVIRVRANSIAPLLDDKPIGQEYRTDFRDLGPSHQSAMPRRDILGMMSWKCQYRIHSARVIEFTGHGHAVQDTDPQDSPVLATANFLGPTNHHQPITVTFYANGVAEGSNDLHGIWFLHGNDLIFRWGDLMDTCKLSPDRKTFNGKTLNGDPVNGQIADGSL